MDRTRVFFWCARITEATLKAFSLTCIARDGKHDATRRLVTAQVLIILGISVLAISPDSSVGRARH